MQINATTKQWGFFMDVRKWIPKRTIFRAISGSHGYGLNTENSDEDIRGICIPPMEYYLGFTNVFEQYVSNDPDEQIYSIRKYFKLAADCNPNIIELLYLSGQEILEIDAYGLAVLAVKDKFLSKKARHTFSGYAMSQLKRIQGHYKWLMDPPTKPSRESYKMGGWGSDSCDDDKYDERAYQSVKIEWDHYQTWKKNRNPARAALEIEHGYDTKHAMHLVRLMKMGIEILRDGTVTTKRTKDREELLGIRNGSMTYMEIIEYADHLKAEMEREAEKSELPNGPNRKELDRILVNITTQYFDEHD